MAVHGTLAIAMAFTLTSLSTVVVALRFYSRHFLQGQLRSPDWVMLAALLTTWGTPIVNWYQVIYTDYSHVHDKESLYFVTRGSLLTMWIFRLNYMIDHLLIKTSILLFYNYVTSANRLFYWIVRCMLCFVIISSLVMILISIFLCNPPQNGWDPDVFWKSFKGVYPKRCMNPSVLWLFNAGYNLATDAIIWLLPIPFFLNLQTMPVKHRLELVAIFSIGILAIAASAKRLAVTLQWLSSWEEAGLQWGNLLIWSQVEQHAGIIAASIPFLRPIFRKMVRAVRVRERQSPSPSPKLMIEPMPLRTPIIPSPAPTFGSDSVFRAPDTPLTPIKPEMQVLHTV